MFKIRTRLSLQWVESMTVRWHQVGWLVYAVSFQTVSVYKYAKLWFLEAMAFLAAVVCSWMKWRWWKSRGMVVRSRSIREFHFPFCTFPKLCWCGVEHWCPRAHFITGSVFNTRYRPSLAMLLQSGQLRQLASARRWQQRPRQAYALAQYDNTSKTKQASWSTLILTHYKKQLLQKTSLSRTRKVMHYRV